MILHPFSGQCIFLFYAIHSPYYKLRPSALILSYPVASLENADSPCQSTVQSLAFTMTLDLVLAIIIALG